MASEDDPAHAASLVQACWHDAASARLMLLPPSPLHSASPSSPLLTPPSAPPCSASSKESQRGVGKGGVGVEGINRYHQVSNLMLFCLIRFTPTPLLLSSKLIHADVSLNLSWLKIRLSDSDIYIYKEREREREREREVRGSNPRLVGLRVLGRDEHPVIKGLRPPEHRAGQFHPDLKTL